MNTAEIKSNLHRLVVETDDINILNKIETFFLQLKTKNIDWWDILSVHEKKSIEKGIKQLDNGEGIPYNIVREKVENLLTNYE